MTAMTNETTASISRRRLRLRRRGAVSVEMALVLPLVLLFLLGIFEYGRFVMTLQVLTNASREGCRYAVTHINAVTIGGVTYGNGTANVNTVISNFSAGVSLTGQTTQIFASDSLGNNVGTWTSAQEGQSVCVKILGNYVPLMSKYLYMPTTIPITAETVMRVEGS